LANYKGGATTICPYYEREAKLSISCQGVIDESQNMTKFESTEAKKKWQENVCFTYQYDKCPIVKILEATEENPVSKIELHADEQVIYDYIVSYTSKNLFPPSNREIRKATHFSSVDSVNRLLKNLNELGLIKIDSCKSRAIKINGYKIVKIN
jgi:hypothetical protein